MPVPSGYVNAVNQVSNGAGGYEDWDGSSHEWGQLPKTQITPQVGGVDTPSITPSATTYTANIKLLVVVNTQDDVEAGQVLTNEFPNVISILPNEVAKAKTAGDQVVTRVSCIALITGATPGAGAKLASSVEATVASNLRTFTFSASDNVKYLNIGFADNGTAADTQFFVEGFADA